MYVETLPPTSSRRRPCPAQVFWDGVVADLLRDPTKWLALPQASIKGKLVRDKQSQILQCCGRRGVQVKTASDDLYIYVQVKQPAKGLL